MRHVLLGLVAAGLLASCESLDVEMLTPEFHEEQARKAEERQAEEKRLIFGEEPTRKQGPAPTPGAAAAAASSPAAAPASGSVPAAAASAPRDLDRLIEAFDPALVAQLTPGDVTLLGQAAGEALTQNEPGATATWRNGETRHAGTMVPGARSAGAGGAECRDFSASLIVSANLSRAQGSACRDGADWRIVAAGR